MVPPAHMYRLIQEATAAPACEVVEFPNAHHMDAFDVSPDIYWSSLRLFLEKHGDYPFPRVADF